MPNTKSAERRTRSSARQRLRNRSAKAALKTLESAYLELVQAGKKDAAIPALRAVSSALDKAAKAGVVHPAKADRKKSRLTRHLPKG